jgi:hypothetical protein
MFALLSARGGGGRGLYSLVQVHCKKSRWIIGKIFIGVCTADFFGNLKSERYRSPSYSLTAITSSSAALVQHLLPSHSLCCPRTAPAAPPKCQTDLT